VNVGSGGEVRVEPIVMDVLVYLARHAGQVVRWEVFIKNVKKDYRLIMSVKDESATLPAASPTPEPELPRATKPLRGPASFLTKLEWVTWSVPVVPENPYRTLSRRQPFIMMMQATDLWELNDLSKCRWLHRSRLRTVHVQ
jgi:hypothetical protein